MRMKKQAAEPLDVSIELFKAFADPVRLRLLNLLADGEVCVCHLHEASGLAAIHGFPPSGVSQETGIGGRPQGRAVGALPAGETGR